MQIDKNEVQEYCKKIDVKHFFTFARLEFMICLNLKWETSQSKHKKIKAKTNIGLKIKNVKDTPKSNIKNEASF
ncbi:unnamed protein product [Paramecium sonneborni]|uniref:Uncharacterized protein n=1 Tax=Paramecium sonneborni TaxID=65129 RepID=A0A8S1RLV3_9CILI|nr:unnamed protein product [Paramecium sonneborni]